MADLVVVEWEEEVGELSKNVAWVAPRVIAKKRNAQWLSLDRPRSYPALHSFDHPTSLLCPLPPRPRLPLHSHLFLFSVFFK